jgi:uncharacterized integral membrane protein
MKSRFGKKTGYKESGSAMEAIKTTVGFILLVVFAILLIAFLRSISVDFAPPLTALPLAMGMLGDPFRTTRRMKVPFRSRVGHRERAFTTFCKICVGVGIVLLLLYFLVAGLDLMTSLE